MCCRYNRYIIEIFEGLWMIIIILWLYEYQRDLLSIIDTDIYRN